MSFAVETQQLTFHYGKKPAIKNFTVNLKEDQIIGLIGRNGSGKTTFLKLCAGLLPPTDGVIKVFAQNPLNNLKVLPNIIYSYPDVSHKASLPLERIIEDFVLFYPSFDRTFAYRLVEFFSLSRHAKYSSLSQGMTSVFNFICAIASRAKLTLLDEPLLGMDISVRKKVYDILLRDYMENPRTIIISSHILSELEDLLSEFLIIDAGEIILYKNQEEVQSMAYRVEGTREAVTAFSASRPVLQMEHKVTGSYAVIDSSFGEAAERECKQLNLAVVRVRPEELYIYKTNHGKEMDFDCLWGN